MPPGRPERWTAPKPGGTRHRRRSCLLYTSGFQVGKLQPLVDKYIEMIANIEQELADLKASLEPDTIIETTFEEKDEADDDVTEDAPAAPAEEKPEADEAKTCPQCGAPVSDDALFCNKCGAQL